VVVESKVLDAARLFLNSLVRIPLKNGYSSAVYVVFCLGSGLCDELIPCSEESYRVYVCVCVSNFVWSRTLKDEVSVTVEVSVN
jgi:hypothetical protein